MIKLFDINIKPHNIFKGSKGLPKTDNTLPRLKQLRSDCVTFSSSKLAIESPETKMLKQVSKILDDLKLQADQPLRITANRDYLPFVNLMVQEAYKRGSGYVSVKIIEPEIEKLKAQYNVQTEFDFNQKIEDYWQEQGAATVNLTAIKQSPYVSSGLTKAETEAQIRKIVPEIPSDIKENLLKLVDPGEILDEKVTLQKGQAVRFSVDREHEALVLPLLEYMYKNGYGPVDVSFTEAPEFDLSKNIAKFASEKVLNNVPGYMPEIYREMLEKQCIRISFSAPDPQRNADLTPEESKKLSAYNSKVSKSFASYFAEILNNNKRLVLNVPTTKSSLSAYGDVTSDPIEALRLFAKESININRVGKFDAHMDKLEQVAKKMNDLLKEGYKTIHFVSYDPQTGQPDGQTDIKVSLTNKSKFILTRKVTPGGEVYTANTPSEEVFSTPDMTKTNGFVTTTRPMKFDGKYFDTVKFWFKEGHIEKLPDGRHKFTVNGKTEGPEVEAVQNYLNNNNKVDMLGEVSLVAGSPIFDLNRVFKSTLLDENATCHLALGNGYPNCIIQDDLNGKSLSEYLDEVHCNRGADDHNDFMVGGPNVKVVALKDETSPPIVLIENNEYQV